MPTLETTRREKAGRTATRPVQFGSRRNDRRRAIEERRRARVLAALKGLVADLESNRAAWARVDDDRLAEGGRGYASNEEALAFFFFKELDESRSLGQYFFPVTRAMWDALTAKAAALSKATGQQWNETDVIELAAEALEARLLSDRLATVKWLRGRLRRSGGATLKLGLPFECFFDGALGAWLQNEIIEKEGLNRGPDYFTSADLVCAAIADESFLADVLRKAAGVRS